MSKCIDHNEYVEWVTTASSFRQDSCPPTGVDYPGGCVSDEMLIEAEKLPGRAVSGAEDYRYACPTNWRSYQGQFAEEDHETGWNQFELRMWDGRIGRWMSTDPYGQYHSPYLGMGNNPVSRIDPNGGHDSYRDARLERKRIRKEMGRKAFIEKFGKVKIHKDELGEYYLQDKGGYTQYDAGDSFSKVIVETTLKGGKFDGAKVNRLRTGKTYITYPRRNYLNPMAHDKFSIEYYDNRKLGLEVERVLGHLETPQNIAISSGTGVTGIGVAAHLKDLATNPANIYLGVATTLASSAIEVDKKTLAAVATNYLIHGSNSGVYSIFHYNGSKVTYGFYDAGNHKYLGGLSQGSYGF